MFGDPNENNLMDELIGADSGMNAGKRHINRKQLVEMVTAMRRDGDEVEEILDSLRDYIVDFKNTVDRPMVLPIVQDVDDGKYGASRKWLPRDAGDVRRATGGVGASQMPMRPQAVDYQGMANVQPMMAQTMGITEQIREMYFKYVEAFKTGDLDSAMFYKNAFNELLQMRNSMYPAAGFGGMNGLGMGNNAQQNQDDGDDWIKQMMAAMVTNMMNQNQQGGGKTTVFDDIEKLGKIKDVMGWGNPNSAGGLSENAAIAAMQVAAPEIGKLTDTVGQLVQTRQEGRKAEANQATFSEMQDREREIRANYTACPQCEAVIPKWAKQCHKCGVIFNDQFSGSTSEYGRELPKRRVAGESLGSSDPAMQGLVGNVNVPLTRPPQESMQSMQQAPSVRPTDYPMQTDEWEEEEMTEADYWFEDYYPRLEEWVEQGADPKKKIQAVWALGSAYEQRQLLFLAQERGANGLVEGLAAIANTEEKQTALVFLTQPNSIGWLEEMFKEVRLMANEDNIVLSSNDIGEFNARWPGGPKARPPTDEELMPQMVGQEPRQVNVRDPNPIEDDMVPDIAFKPPAHIEQTSAISLKEKLRRKQLGLE